MKRLMGICLVVVVVGCTGNDPIQQAQLEELRTQNELLKQQVDREAAKDDQQAAADAASAEHRRRLAFIDGKAEYVANAVNKYRMSMERTANATERQFREITGEKTIGRIGQDDGPSYYTQLFNEVRAAAIKKTMHIKDNKKFEDVVFDEIENWMRPQG